MKLYKLFDLTVQLIIALTGISFLIIKEFPFQIVIYFYCIAGGWQLISFFYHLFLIKNWVLRRDRSKYGEIIFWILIIGLICLLLLLIKLPLLLFYLFGLMIVSPFLAIWYFLIGLNELKLMNKISLLHLK